MNNKIPKEIKPLLFCYESKIKNSFKDKILGVYLYNSVALGAFNVNKSDIDFVTILKEEFTNDEITKLDAIHTELNMKDKYARRMEGMYITKDKIVKTNDEILPYAYFADERLHDYGYYDINYVTWWTLKNNGIGVNSPDISNFDINVVWDNVIETMNYNLNKYWKSKLESESIFLKDVWIEFSVLTLCRILYTLDHKDIISKEEAAKYEITNLPNDLKLIIQEALRLREGNSDKSFYLLNKERLEDIIKFIHYIIDYCNNKYGFNKK